MEVYSDTFHEQIVKRERSSKDALLSGLAIAGASIVIFILLLTPIGFKLNILGVVLAMGVGYITARFVRSHSSVEFEYSVTNGTMDVAKVIAKSSRKEMFSITLDKISRMGIADERNTLALQNGKFDKKYDLTTNTKNPENQTYFIVARIKEKNSIIYFQPNEDILKACKKYVPRALFY